MAALVRHETLPLRRAIGCADAPEIARAKQFVSAINSSVQASADACGVARFDNTDSGLTEPEAAKNHFPAPDYVHHVPGRLRLKAAEFRDNPSILEAACRELEAIPGISSVSSNRLTGSILVEYDPLFSPPAALLEAMQERGFPCVGLEAPVLANSGHSSLTALFAGAAVRTLCEWFVERLIVFAITAVI